MSESAETASSQAAPPPAPAARDSKESLSASVKLAYNAPQLVTAAMAIPLLVHMTKFYVDVVMVPAGVLGLSVAVARAFDAITDPLMGHLSDRTRTRFGRRKPWIALAALPMAATFFLLFTPPEGLTGSAAFGWFATCFTAYFLFHTMVSIPYQALGTELTLDPAERARLFGMHSAAIALGTIFASILPSVLEGGGMTDPRARFSSMAVLYAGGIALLFSVLLLVVRERPEFSRKPPNPFIPGVRRAFRNRPFRRLFAALLVYAAPSAIPATMMPFFVSYVIQPDNPTQWLGIYLVTYLGVGFAFLPFWVKITHRIGKRNAWRVCGSIGVVGGASLFLVGPGDTQLAFWLYVFVGTQSAFFHFLGPSMLADVVDYDELYTGKRREAQYGAFWTFVPKFIAIPGTAIPFAVMGAAGYVPNQPQSPEVIFTIKALYALVPPVFNAAGLLVMWFYPLSERVHGEIRRGVQLHERGEAAIDPLDGKEVPPPSPKGDDSDSWFLDHFSLGELHRFLSGGARAVVRDVTLMALLWGGLTAAGVIYTFNAVGSLDREPGIGPVLAVVCSGLALAAMVFQLLRLGPALRMARRPPDTARIRTHLDASMR